MTKTITVPLTAVTVTLPDSADAWELYTSMLGAGEAADRLTASLAKALVALDRDKAIKIMSEALRADQDFGACDTEPRQIAETLLGQGRNDNFNWSLCF